MLKAYDYGKILTLDSLSKIKVDNLVRQARKETKRLYLDTLDLDSGRRIDLVTSSTRFGGQRYWFSCPECKRRVGVLYGGPDGLSCRMCVGYRYRGSRYKGMHE